MAPFLVKSSEHNEVLLFMPLTLPRTLSQRLNGSSFVWKPSVKRSMSPARESSEPETRDLFGGGSFLSLVGESQPRFDGMLSDIRQGTTILFFLLVNLKYNLSERSMKTLPSVTQEQAQRTHDDGECRLVVCPLPTCSLQNGGKGREKRRFVSSKSSLPRPSKEFDEIKNNWEVVSSHGKGRVRDGVLTKMLSDQEVVGTTRGGKYRGGELDFGLISMCEF